MLHIQLIVSGMSQGCLYGLVALGFVLIYKATETVSFVQGDLMMLGSFAGLAGMSYLHFPYWAAVPAAITGCGLFGWLLERATIRSLIGQPAFSVVMLTIGIGYMLRGAITMIPGFGAETHTLPAPYLGAMIATGQVVLDVPQLVVISATVMLCLALYAIFKYTRVGIAMQASSQNQLAAYYMGIPVKQLNGLVWAVAAAIAGIAGLLVAPITFVHANMGLLGLKAFPAAVIGGFGNIPGALVGGLIVGLVEAFAGFYLPEGVKDIAPYVLVLLVLAWRPNGLIGSSLHKKV